MITAIWAWLTAPSSWTGADGIPVRLAEHLGYSFLVVLIASRGFTGTDHVDGTERDQ